MAHIGLDLDNTIIDYDAAFPRVGEATGLLAPGHGLTGKAAVKAHLLSHDGGMDRWMRLQGQVYGPRIAFAVPFDGAPELVRRLIAQGHRVSVISHKTRLGHFDETRTCLWDAARWWLREHRIVTDTADGLDEEDVVFAETREEKLREIVRRACDLFVDDLLAVLLHPDFPPNVERIWFAGRDDAHDRSGLAPHRDWDEVAAAVDRHLERIERSA